METKQRGSSPALWASLHAWAQPRKWLLIAAALCAAVQPLPPSAWGEFLKLGFALALVVPAVNLLGDSAKSLAAYFGIAAVGLVAGLIAAATSGPEVVVGLVAVTEGNYALALAELIGSQVIHWLLVIPALVLLHRGRRGGGIILSKRGMAQHGVPAIIMPCALAVTFLLAGWSNPPYTYPSTVGIQGGMTIFLLGLCLAGGVWFFDILRHHEGQETEEATVANSSAWLDVTLGLAAVVMASWFCVNSAEQLGQLTGLSQSVVGGWCVAGLTNLPELVAGITILSDDDEDPATALAMVHLSMVMNSVAGAAALTCVVWFAMPLVRDTGLQFLCFATLPLGALYYTVLRLSWLDHRYLRFAGLASVVLIVAHWYYYSS